MEKDHVFCPDQCKLQYHRLYQVWGSCLRNKREVIPGGYVAQLTAERRHSALTIPEWVIIYMYYNIARVCACLLKIFYLE